MSNSKATSECLSQSQSQDSSSLEEVGPRHSSGALYVSAQEVLQKYSHCAHCHARLHFTYLTDFSRNTTQETARCPECQNQAHRVMHRLQ
ncbi:MAG: hypothetical protein RJB38_2339 [Pseudomonadota bacterium]|jgi:hypothetical protein